LKNKSIKISIIIPCYNEEKYISTVLTNVNKQKKLFNLEIIVVDDGSKDKTKEILKKYKKIIDKIVTKKKNEGKGSAIKLGLKYVTGKYTLIQDADLEYSPSDYSKIFYPLFKFNADAVYGSRFISNEARRIIYFKNELANKFLTYMSNIVSGLNLSDIEVGYKVFRTSVLKSLNLKEKSFGFEIESTMKLAKNKFKIFEVGISYNGRTYAEGKKIRTIDGVLALFCIFKYRFFN
jgi:glycosyltransferase involved in cell wall biosynthesis